VGAVPVASAYNAPGFKKSAPIFPTKDPPIHAFGTAATATLEVAVASTAKAFKSPVRVASFTISVTVEYRARSITPRIARRRIESREHLGRYRWIVERALA